MISVSNPVLVRSRCSRSELKGVSIMFWGLILCLICSFSIWTNLRTLSHHTSLIKSEDDMKREPLCRKLPDGVDYCEIEGDIRIEANTSTIYVFTPDERLGPNSTTSWRTKPYIRWYIQRNVKLWKVQIVRYSERENYNVKCKHDKYHTAPAILFSVGGQVGNYYHSFSDVIFPLYTTSYRFQRDVHFLASDYQGWWINKFQDIFNVLTRHPIVDIDNECWEVHCYKKMVVGLKYHVDLVVDDRSVSEYSTGVSMQNFRHLLRDAYSLERKTSISRQRGSTSPRLMIVSRKKTRVILNQEEISQVAREVGFEVVLADDVSTFDVPRFANLVNSCDVLMGIHGAGLTNMLFLPDNAVLIQLIPFGELSVIARIDYRDPTPGMNIQYLEYEISANESTLSHQYPIDHPVLRDPGSIHKKGWYAMSSVYLDNQNVTVDVGKLSATLVQAMKLLVRN
uniref:GT61_4 n=1 Tax=Plantago ovata TaxID=185002 RepID=S5RXI0_PLAOV|nr:GT61_4 [Plantago ovata]